jgi:pimeloyl-ACP methyl ester carboxylesterase
LSLQQNTSNSTIYFISGLGADWRMFQFLKLPIGQTYKHVEWLEPLSLDEPIQEYVKRLTFQIKDPDPILIGLSFGGVIAIELAKIIKVKKLIIISSLATHHSLPKLYSLAGKANFHKLIPFWLMKSVHPVAPLFFGAHTPFEKALLKDVMLNINEKFLRWSLGQLFTWKQEKPLPNLIQLHGTKDRILPLCQRAGLIKVTGGEHLMVLHQADEINSILSKILANDHDR